MQQSGPSSDVASSSELRVLEDAPGTEPVAYEQNAAHKGPDDHAGLPDERERRAETRGVPENCGQRLGSGFVDAGFQRHEFEDDVDQPVRALENEGQEEGWG